MAKRLNPKNDAVFRLLFGTQDDKDALIALLNAVLQLEGEKRIVDVTVVQNRELTAEWLSDKTVRLDILAVTKDGTQIDIEMQIADQGNMINRTLYYWSRTFTNSFKKGADYQNLKQTIVIVIVDFRLFHSERFHTTFHLYEDHDKSHMLTDMIEIHFIEHPKFLKVRKDMQDALHRWLLFLDDKTDEFELEELKRMDQVIKKADDYLQRISGDERVRLLAEAREEAEHERASYIGYGERKGMIEGRMEGKIEGKTEVAANMLELGLDIGVIAKSTGLSEEEIVKLRKN